ncbi:Indoleamine 2,3-dioxygenase [Echinococcus granulosus]|uniref:Indoleamine 2,3-dioxygenase n=1 Tax=Echinococcus granulosus TaxID=6210 RepID=W6U4A0_ECHGR|nr:Indoleamine 2,3-dioxygenase [Echinococcus granulosus]EUB55431.1 Indoleamine 2,3-dioxygenase [Echinococcus granulosus]
MNPVYGSLTRCNDQTMQALEDYKISPVTGCLLGQPTTPPPSLLPFRRLLEHSHELLNSGKLRESIEKLPTLDMAQLKSHEEKRLAHKILAFLAAQYVWQNGDRNPAEILPAVIAMPLIEVSIELGCQPLLGHIDLVLSNCFPEKTQLLQRQVFFTEFIPSDQPNWLPFIEVTADIELSFCDGAKIMMHIINSVQKNNTKTAVECLIKLGDVISIMRQQLLLLLNTHQFIPDGCALSGLGGLQMQQLFMNSLIKIHLFYTMQLACVDEELFLEKEPGLHFITLKTLLTHLYSAFAHLLIEELDPKAFYCEMRPFLSGWSHGKISKGLVYEGVPDSVLTGAETGDLSGETIPKKRVYLGASAGQSISLQSFDAFLGIEHFKDVEKFFADLRKYMILEHRHFIEDLKQHVHLRDFVERSSSKELKTAYNSCVNELLLFRKDHLLIVEKFIIAPSKMYAAKVESLKSQGTGGTALDQFLESVIARTEAALIQC